MLQKIQHYLSLVKFSHTIFALPFAVIGFILALVQYNLELQWSLAVKILLCMVLARSAAMAFNRWTDREIDAQNARTKIREIPSGIIKAKDALTFTIINCIAFVVTTWFINPLCFYLSFVALAVILGYSLTKRFTALCHFVLGLGLSLAPLGAWIAVSGEFDFLPLLFSFAVLTWVSGFDIIYALQDEQFDKEHHLHSIPQYFGGKKALSLSRTLHISSSLFILSAGVNGGFGIIFFIGWAFFSFLLMHQHRLVKHDDLSKVNLAFFTTNGIASLAFSIFVVSDVILNSSYSLF
ncbi:MAG: UbiA-like polyprenyltransferase [Bacteroidia bacterium]